MATMLRELCMLYIQDFDVVFERETDPIDLFCEQHSRQAQEQLLDELRRYHADLRSGRRSIKDLVSMGMEYMPGDELQPETWLPHLITYLEEKIVSTR